MLSVVARDVATSRERQANQEEKEKVVEVENIKSDKDEDAADKDEDDSDDEDDEMKALAEQMEKRRTAQNSRTFLVAVVLDEGFLPVKGMSASSRSQSKRRKKQASRTGERPRTAPMSRGATLAIRLRGSAAASRRDEMNSIAVALEEKPVFTCAIRCSLGVFRDPPHLAAGGNRLAVLAEVAMTKMQIFRARKYTRWNDIKTDTST